MNEKNRCRALNVRFREGMKSFGRFIHGKSYRGLNCEGRLVQYDCVVTPIGIGFEAMNDREPSFYLEWGDEDFDWRWTELLKLIGIKA